MYNDSLKIKGIRLPLGGMFFDDSCLIMTGFDRGLRLGRITAEFWDADIDWN